MLNNCHRKVMHSHSHLGTAVVFVADVCLIAHAVYEKNIYIKKKKEKEMEHS